MTRKTNGSFNIGKLFDLISENARKNDLAHDEIKVELQRNRIELFEKVNDVKERLIKIESQPAHESFQKSFCPNTSAIKELEETGSKGLKEYEIQHQDDHKELNSVLRGISDKLEMLNIKLTTIEGRITSIEAGRGLSMWLVGGIAGLAVALIVLLAEHLLSGV